MQKLLMLGLLLTCFSAWSSPAGSLEKLLFKTSQRGRVGSSYLKAGRQGLTQGEQTSVPFLNSLDQREIRTFFTIQSKAGPIAVSERFDTIQIAFIHRTGKTIKSLQNTDTLRAVVNKSSSVMKKIEEGLNRAFMDSGYEGSAPKISRSILARPTDTVTYINTFEVFKKDLRQIDLGAFERFLDDLGDI